MEMSEWWPQLRPETRTRLTEHNGEPVTPEIVGEIAEVGGLGEFAEGWEPDADSPGWFLPPDAVVDWIEATSNGEA